MLLTQIIFYLFFYHSIYISESFFVCAVSLTHSLRLFKPHLARHKYIISRRLHWMPLKLELFSSKTTCLQTTVVSTAHGCDVSACAAGNKIDRLGIGETVTWDQLLIRAGHVRNRPIPITGQSIGASLKKKKLSETWTNPEERFLALKYCVIPPNSFLKLCSCLAWESNSFPTV